MTKPHIVDAGPYQAHVHNTDVEVYDSDVLLFSFRVAPGTLGIDLRRMITNTVLAYQAGERDGERKGRSLSQAEIRRAMGFDQ